MLLVTFIILIKEIKMQKDIDYSKFKSLEEAYKAGYNQAIQDKKIETTQIQILNAQRQLDDLYFQNQIACSLRSMDTIYNESIEY